MRDRAYPPGPSMLAAIRGMRDMGGGNDLSGIPVFFADVARRYGGIAHWTIFRRHFFLLDDPALIEDAFVAKSRDYKKGRGIARLRRLLGNGLLSSEEPVHLRQRRLLGPAFHRDRIADYGRMMVAATLAQSAGWTDGTTLAIDAEMTHLTLGITAQTLFSTNVADRADTIRTAITTVMQTFPAAISRFSELLDVFPVLPVTRRFLKARAELDRVIYAIIARRRADPAEHDDLLAMLLAARDGDGAMDDVQIRDEALTLFLAGHETTANALAWAWYLLARHPAVAERMYAELDRVLGDRPPDPGDLPQLTYVRDVFAETMRLYPPAWVLGRRAVRDTAIGGGFVPRGSVVLASQLVTHRNPRYWIEPDSFRPQRWTDGSLPAQRLAFFPFGGGNRRCIGESFAWMEGVLVLATIAQRFAIEALDDTPVDVEPLVTLRPRTAIRVRLRSRARTTGVSATL